MAIGQGETPILPEIKIPLPLGDELPAPVLQGGISLTQNWDKNGNIFYTDENGNRVNNSIGLLENLKRKAQTIGTNIKDAFNSQPYDRRDTFYTSPMPTLINQYDNGNISADELARLSKNRMEDEIYRAEKDQRESNINAGLGTALSAASFAPIFNIPVVGSGLGGAMYDIGQGLVEGDNINELVNRANRGYAIGESVGAIPYVGKGINKLSGGKIGDSIANSKAAEIANKAADKFKQSKLYDALMTDIRAFNPNKQIAYHGSPYDFERFSNEAIGTGEGAQAHGYGHYSALNKDVAQDYADRLTRNPFSNDEFLNSTTLKNLSENAKTNIGLFGKEDAEMLLKEDLAYNKNRLARIEELKQQGTYNPESESEVLQNIQRIRNDLDLLTNFDISKISKNNGQLYKLSIPKRDVMLREDLPFSKQPKAVQDALKNIGNNQNSWADKKYIDFWEYPENEFYNSAINGNATGKEIQNLLNNFAGRNNASSQILNDYGIKGISYNGGIDGEAAVIFNPDDIDIVRKFYTKEGAEDYFKRMYPNSIGATAAAIENGLVDKNYWKQYAKDNLLGNSVNIPGYTTVNFTNNNLMRDYPYNMPEYPNLFEQLTNSKYGFSTNYNKEKDRLYDHLINNDNNRLFDYLIEVIQDNDGNIHHNYKMMKNIKRGDKP